MKKTKGFMSMEINKKCFIIIQTISLLVQVILGYIFIWLSDLLNSVPALNMITQIIGDFLTNAVFLQTNVISLFNLSAILSYIIGIPFFLLIYGLMGYILAQFKQKNLTLNYTFMSFIIIAIFYSLIGWFLILIGVLNWP